MNPLKKFFVRVICISTFAFFIFSTHPVSADTVISTDIGADTHWTVANSPYIIAEDITVVSGATLTIDPGVAVKFGSTRLQIAGSLVAHGSSDKKITFTSADNEPWGIDVINGSMILRESELTHPANGDVLYLSGAHSDIQGVHITGGTTAVHMVNGSEVSIFGSFFEHVTTGVLVDASSNTTLIRLAVYYVDYGIRNSGSVFISQGAHYANSQYGVLNEGVNNITAFNTWWGDVSGPYHPVLNSGAKGQKVSDKVEFNPWLAENVFGPPIVVEPPPVNTCCSSVAFIPGLMGSRLYKQQVLENQLWEPNRNVDVHKLYLNTDGKSLDSSIYTRDIIERTNLPVSNIDIYRTFSDFMDGLVADNTIIQWKALPYDWRLDPFDIVQRGIQIGNNISYSASLSSSQVPFMIAELQKLADTSKNGKVTLITHSNGGLVAKALVQKLQTMKTAGQSNLLDHIDRVIMVAAPQLGTPVAINSILHGDEQNLGFMGFPLSKQTARGLAENMPAGYNMLPSEKYFTQVADPVVVFDPSLDKLNNWRSLYGNSISTYQTMQDFLLASRDHRTDPQLSNISAPNVLVSSLLTNAKTEHQNIDNWQFPASIDVIQIAGWGQPTITGIQYYAKQNGCKFVSITTCEPIYVLARKPLLNNEGDKTVIYPSAISLNATDFYFNLRALNNDQNTNLVHKNILESASLHNLIKNRLTNDLNLPEFITDFKPELDSNNQELKLAVHSPATIHIHDSLGNHTGPIANPDVNSDLELAEQNVPNSYYFSLGEDQYTGFEVTGGEKISLTGTGLGTFTLDYEQTLGGNTAVNTTFTDIPVTPSTKAELVIPVVGQQPTLNLDIEGDGKVDFTVKPNAEFDVILYLESMKKVIKTFNLPKNSEDTLMKKIDKTVNLIKSGKLKNAQQSIQTAVRQLELNRGKIKKLSADDKNALIMMLNQLLDNLN
jgi:pimeloyl-ACP methyl ester carboxylesterase